MPWLAAEELDTARWLVGRLIGVLYAIAFANAATGWRGLLGDDGLLPVRAHLAFLDPGKNPTVFAWRYSDRGALAVAWGGCIVSLLLVAGVPQQAPSWVPLALWLGLWLAYMSIVNVGQIWYGFGWETILLEAGFYAAFLGSDGDSPSWATMLALRWLLFRVEFGAGLIKLRGDRCWRDLTCLEYHHETQPMPGPLSWWAHNRPRWWHRVEVAGNHVTQLVVPWALFLPHPAAGAAALVVIATQGWLMLTGNYAWLNAVTIVLAVSALPDGWLGWLPLPHESGGVPVWFGVVTLAVAALTLALSWWPVRNMTSPGQVMNTSFNRLRLVGSYGAFGSVTRSRNEIVIEGSNAVRPDRNAEWLAYEFKGKPGDPSRRPGQVAPWHLRLDWLMWFAALPHRSMSQARWFRRLLAALLEGNPHVLALLRHNPFPGAPPRWVRAVEYRYRFTTPEERRATGAFWHRTPMGTYAGAQSGESAMSGQPGMS